MQLVYSSTPSAIPEGNAVTPRCDSLGSMHVSLRSTSGAPIGSGATALSTAGGNTAGSTSMVTLLAANANRRGATITNASGALLLADFSTAVSTAAYQAPIQADGGYYEVPFGYTGAVYGMWAAATTRVAVARELF